MEPDELRELEIVVAAPHSALRSDADQTARMVTAVRSPRRPHPRPPARPDVRIAPWRHGGLGPGLRGGRTANVAIEIDGDPSRQDLDYELARGPWTPAASSRSTATRIPRRSSRTRKPPSRTLGSPVCLRIASSIAGRRTSCWLGWQGPAKLLRKASELKKPDTTYEYKADTYKQSHLRGMRT